MNIHFRYRSWLFSIILGLVFLNLSGQTAMLEFPWSKETLNWELYPIDSTGFYITEFQQSDKPNTIQKNVARYDENFQLLHNYSLEVDSRYQLVRMSDHYQGGLFLLYQKTFGVDLFVMYLKPDGTYERHDVPLLETISLEHFEVLEDKALIGGLFENEPAYFLFNFDIDRLIPLDRFYQPGAKLIQSRVDKNSRVISIITSDTFSNGQSTFTLRNYDYEGQLLRTTTLKPPGFHDLNSASITNFKNGDQFVIGNYTNANLQGTTGVYMAKIESNGDQKFNLIPYFQLEGFYDYLPEQKAQRKVEKAQRKFLKKGAWSTSDQLLINTPQIAGNRIYSVALSDFNSRSQRSQLIFNSSLELVKGVPLPDFKARNYWTYQDEFFALGWNKQLQVSRSNAQEVKLSAIPIDLSELGDGSEDIFIRNLRHWYQNRILIGYSFERNGTNFFAIKTQEIY